MNTAKDSTEDPTQDTMQAATSSLAGAVHVDASSKKVQQTSENIKGLQLAPVVEPNTKTTNYSTKDTTEDTKQAAASPAAGAVHVDALSRKVQQASEKTKGFTDGPKYYLEDDKKRTSGQKYYAKDHEKLLSGLELETVSSKRANGKSRNKFGKSKETADPLAIVAATPFKKTRTSTRTRQNNRRTRIVARASTEDTNPLTFSPTMEEEPYDDSDSDDEDETPGAVWVPGINSTGLEEHDLEEVEKDPTRHFNETNEAFVAQLMDEIPSHAEIVKDDGTNSRRSALLCPGRVVILLAIVFCLVIIAIAVAIPLALKKDDDPATPVTAPGAPFPTTLLPASTVNLKSIDDFRTALGLSGDPAWSDPNTDQYRALKWLASEDPARLSPYDTSRRVLIERYTVALLYFSTNGPGWTSQHGFLLQESVCSWNNHDTSDNTFGKATVGILCQIKNDESVDHIDLGKYKINIS